MIKREQRNNESEEEQPAIYLGFINLLSFVISNKIITTFR